MRLLKLTICLLLSVVLFCPAVYAMDLSAEAAVAIDGATGKVLCEKNAYTRLGMASTTKIMTLIIALERGNPEDIVTVDKRAEGVEGSSLYLRGGDKLSLRNLLFGMMLRSGNDAATAVALHFSPTVEEFASLMTEKAKELGLKDTCFKNPHGLHEEGHYTTAYDLAQITRYGFTLDGFAEIVASEKFVIDENIETKLVTNNNKLLYLYAGADGVKTGYTPETGRTLVGSATRDGMRVICVTLNDGDDWNDHINMFNYSFEHFKSFILTRKDQGFGCAPVKKGQDAEVPLLAQEELSCLVDSDSTVKATVTTNTEITAPLKKGDVLGKVVFSNEDGVLAETNLIAGCDVEKEKKLGVFWRIIKWITRK